MLKDQEHEVAQGPVFSKRQLRVNAVFLDSSKHMQRLHRERLTQTITQEHQWVEVLDPRNAQSVLKACDDCGVVKSENSVVRNCAAEKPQKLISAAHNVFIQ